jgi:hypothetical protein
MDFARSGLELFLRPGSRILPGVLRRKRRARRAVCVHVDLVAVLGRSGRDCQFVPAFPTHFHFVCRRHPTPVGALARDSGEFARAARKRPGALKGGLAASGGYFALERTPVPVSVGMFVDELAALEAAAGDKVGEAPVREPCVVPFLVAGFLQAADFGRFNW